MTRAGWGRSSRPGPASAPVVPGEPTGCDPSAGANHRSSQASRRTYRRRGTARSCPRARPGALALDRGDEARPAVQVAWHEVGGADVVSKTNRTRPHKHHRQLLAPRRSRRSPAFQSTEIQAQPASMPPAATAQSITGSASPSTPGSTTVIGIANLAMATGNIGRAGVGVNPLRGQNKCRARATWAPSRTSCPAIATFPRMPPAPCSRRCGACRSIPSRACASPT